MVTDGSEVDADSRTRVESAETDADGVIDALREAVRAALADVVAVGLTVAPDVLIRRLEAVVSTVVVDVP